MTADDKLLTAKTEDLFKLCDKYCEPRFSDFLDGAEQRIIKENVVFPFGYNVITYGGFDENEKKMIGVFPEWQEPDTESFPIVCLKIEGGFSKKLTHRDYLGTIMSLGISSSKLGDIVVDDGCAYVFVHSDISGYVSDNISKIGNQGVKISVIDDTGNVEIKRNYKTIEAVCASGRLDAVVGAAANMSRSESARMIAAGKIKLNHRECLKPSEEIRTGDLLSIRGYGRYIVSDFGNETRKGRIHITLKKYI